jgi:NADPH2:quinone reductase
MIYVLASSASEREVGAVRAIVAATHGGPEVLQLQDVPDPLPAERQALVRVVSAGVNFSDVLAVAGSYPAPPPPFVPGIEVAGRDEDGRPVLALIESGGYGELAVADRRLVFAADGLDLAVAGGYALVTLAAYYGLAHAARIEDGDSVLVLAAAGGLGSTAIQVARALGADAVFAVASSEHKRAQALALGADAAFGYDDELPAADIVVDGVGGEPFLRAFRAARRFGRVLSVGAASGTPPALPPFHELRERSVALVPFSFKALREHDPEFVARTAPAALDLIRRGDVVPLVEAAPLEDAPGVLRRLAERATVGKHVLRP